jgi:hypothetical protein
MPAFQQEIFEEAVPTNLSKAKISELAGQLAEKFQYRTANDLECIVDKLGGRIEYGDWGQGDNGGSLKVYPDGTPRFIIQLYSFAGNLRNRFTIAHELGHYFLHSNVGKKPIAVNRAGSDRLEWEANWFAGAFLLPSQRLRSDWEKHRSVAQIAAAYQVSQPVVEIQLDTLGIAR